MWKLLVSVALITALYGASCDSNSLLDKLTNNRQKRLLFFDEQGSLVKTYANPYVYDFGNSIEENNPLLLNYVNPIQSIIRANTFGSTIYTIPVSDAVLQQINSDPLYQNNFIVLPTRKLSVEISPLCAGRRSQIPSPKLCSNFLNCWDGWAWEQECPAGLLFSNEGFCDYAYNVDCNHRLIKEEPQPVCNKDFDAFKNDANCNEFFVCVHKQAVRFQCPVELAYNEELGVCDYPAKVHCNVTHASGADTTAIPPKDQFTTTAVYEQSVPTTSGPMSSPENKVVISKTEFNSQSLKTLQVAMSRQDAIRKLQLGQLAHIHTGY